MIVFRAILTTLALVAIGSVLAAILVIEAAR